MAGRKKKKKGNMMIAVVLIAIAVVFVAFLLTNKLGVNKSVIDGNTFFGLEASDEAAVIISGVQSETNGKYIDGQFYLSYETVWNELDAGFYYEEASGTLFYTSESETRTWNDEVSLYTDPEGELYINAGLVSDNSVLELYTYTEPNRIVVMYASGEELIGTASSDCDIRVEGSERSDIVTTCKAGDDVICLGMDGWTCVSTLDGYTGYIDSSEVELATEIRDYSGENKAAFERISTGQKISMAWDYVDSVDDNASLDAVMEGVSGLDIICPTWFSLGDSSGGVISYADAAYVQKARDTYGLSVWGLASDYTGEDTTTGAILSTYENRQKIIASLIENALTYGLSGINIDFEKIEDKYGPAYIEFLRELTQQAHNSGIIISVDNYVPGYTSQYRRDAQNAVVDYIIMMGYDEHTAYSEEYGSVASLSYVEEGINATLAEVDAERLVLGVPFYSRGWTVRFGSEGFECEMLFMSSQDEFVAAHGITLSWDDTAAQYAGSGEDTEGRYYIWKEDGESLAAKLNLINTYSLAGASAWRLGMETDDIWQIWTQALG